jgi:ABC-2 type transport system permease protein
MLPLSFVSVTFMANDLMPEWMQTLSAFNPVNWAVEAGREALNASADWGLIASRAGLLVAFLAACLFFAVRAFKTYQRSV